MMSMPLLSGVVCWDKYIHKYVHVLINRNLWYNQRMQFFKHSMLMKSGRTCQLNKGCMNKTITRKHPIVMYEAIVWFHNHMYICDYMTTLYFKMSIKFRDIFSRCGFSTFHSVFEPIMLHTPVLNRFSYTEHEPTNSVYQWYSLAQTPMIKSWMFEVKTIFISRCTSWSVISTEPAMWCQPW